MVGLLYSDMMSCSWGDGLVVMTVFPLEPGGVDIWKDDPGCDSSASTSHADVLPSTETFPNQVHCHRVSCTDF